MKTFYRRRTARSVFL